LRQVRVIGSNGDGLVVVSRISEYHLRGRRIRSILASSKAAQSGLQSLGAQTAPESYLAFVEGNRRRGLGQARRPDDHPDEKY